MLQVNVTKPRLTLQNWSRKYGAAYRVRTAFGEVVVLSSYGTIHDVLTVNGAIFSDRPDFFRMKYAIGEMIGIRNSDDTWRKLRNLSHRYLKQFGEGSSQMEDILIEAVNRRIGDAETAKSSPVDMIGTLKEASLHSISVLLLGRVVDTHNSLLKMLKEYEKKVFECFNPLRPDMMMLEKCRWLIHLPLSTSNELKAFVKLQDALWSMIKKDQQHSAYDSLTKLLLTNVGDATSGSPDDRKSVLTDSEACHACLNLIVAGTTTSSTAMYCIINSLAYRQDVQDKIRAEVLTALCATNSKSITLAQKSMMPYLRATILETLRHFSVTPLGAGVHVAKEDTELKGYGSIPKGTAFVVNAWNLHHEKAFWGDPGNFRPDRFLDEDGEFLPADHPNRKHVLPFGAGPRVCVGEAFAMTRLFLWTSALVNTFVITTAAGCDPEWMDPDRHKDDSVILRPLPCDVLFTRRAKIS